MQDLQHVHLDPRESESTRADIARAAQEETLRRRKNQAGGGNGVQFSTIFAMVDSGLETGADSLRKIPKRNVQKEAESDKNADPMIAAAVDPKAHIVETPKEAPKAKAEQDPKARVVKETATRKTDVPEGTFLQAAALQAKSEQQGRATARQAERNDVKVERKEARVIDKPRSQEKSDVRVESKERPSETAAAQKGQAVSERAAAADTGKSQERRVRQKSKDESDSAGDDRGERKSAESQKGIRADEESARQAQRVRDRADEKSAGPERADGRDPKAAAGKADEGGSAFSVQRDTRDEGQADSARKKRSTGDLEKLTGLHAKTVMDVMPVIPPAPEIAFKPVVETAPKGLAVDAIRAPVKAAAAASSNGSSNTGGHAGADAEARSGQVKDKLGQTAQKLASYLNGRADAVVKPETTFSDMVAKAKLFLDNGRSEMTIQLKPEQLGSLNIKMVVEDGKMQAQFVTDRPEVKELIERNADLLKAKMSEVGIEINAFSVEVRSDAGQANPREGRDGGLRRITEFGSDGDPALSTGSNDAQIAYALAGMGTHLSLVA